MSRLARVPGFLRKYRFPLHLVVLRDILSAEVSSVFWTAWTRWMLAVQGCRAGTGLRVDGRLIVRTASKGSIRIGKRFSANSRQLANLVGMPGPSILCCYGEGSIEIGDDSGMSGTVLSSRSRIVVGDRVNLGGGVRVFDHDFHALDPLDRRDPVRDKANARTFPVEIGDDVFVGAHAMILKGVHIGAASVIGAGAVVTLREVPPGSVVAGNPARVVGRVPGLSS